MLDVIDIRDQFSKHFGVHPRQMVRAPGRVNLIGEHTDYNDGFVFPVAIDRATYVAARPRDDRQVHVVAADIDDEDTFDLDDFGHSAEHPWSNYIRGVVKGLLVAGHQLEGANLFITSDVPRGAGLSSSAALEVAVGYSFQLLNRLDMFGEELALLAQGAENNFVGVQSGIMDQFISALGQQDHALLIDCRDLNARPVLLPTDARIVVCNSNVERKLAGSAYNERREQCAEAVRLFKQWYPQTLALRDISVEQFAAHEAELPDIIRRRARHVVTENERVLRGTAALEQGDIDQFGLLMNESHTSLRDDYEVSIRELDELVTAARSVNGCYGSRLTGAGFGGCTVSLVETSVVDEFVRVVSESYRTATGRETTIYICTASDGVGRAIPE